MKESIHPFDARRHRAQVVELWQCVFAYNSPHNAPQLAIDKKLAVGDGLFFVAEVGRKVVGSVMAGYDGHRGWIYSLAVLPQYRRSCLGTRLMRHAEERLRLLGCLKINLQIMHGNEGVAAFYHKLGYQTEQRISMGKKLPENIRRAEAATPNADFVDLPAFSNQAIRPLRVSRYSIRRAREQDSAELARLAGQLGYPASGKKLRKRLQRLMASASDVVFVAASANGGLVGWVHGVLSQFLESDYRVEVAGLVVDERFHRRGIGRDLLRQVEAWAREHGAEQASVRCRTTREEAHQFYESLGYNETKTQIVFRKSLAQQPKRRAGTSRAQSLKRAIRRQRPACL
jgi:ribosomal protein S18 acetylase RimI-like enzyme